MSSGDLLNEPPVKAESFSAQILTFLFFWFEMWPKDEHGWFSFGKHRALMPCPTLWLTLISWFLSSSDTKTKQSWKLCIFIISFCFRHFPNTAQNRSSDLHCDWHVYNHCGRQKIKKCKWILTDTCLPCVKIKRLRPGQLCVTASVEMDWLPV